MNHSLEVDAIARRRTRADSRPPDEAIGSRSYRKQPPCRRSCPRGYRIGRWLDLPLWAELHYRVLPCLDLVMGLGRGEHRQRLARTRTRHIVPRDLCRHGPSQAASKASAVDVGDPRSLARGLNDGLVRRLDQGRLSAAQRTPRLWALSAVLTSSLDPGRARGS